VRFLGKYQAASLCGRNINGVSALEDAEPPSLMELVTLQSLANNLAVMSLQHKRQDLEQALSGRVRAISELQLHLSHLD